MGDDSTMKFTVIPTDKEKYIQDARDLLNEASEQGFESVFVVGMKDGKVHIKSSMIDDVIFQIGCLEIIKDHVITNWAPLNNDG